MIDILTLWQSSYIYNIMENTKIIYIYILIDPRDNEIRYVGKTAQKLEARVSAHMRDKSSCHKVHWLNELKALGLKPTPWILEEIKGDWPWQYSEKYWIGYLKAWGCNLTNNTSGGDGVPDLPYDIKERLRKVWIGKKHKPETIEKLKICRPNYKHSIETKEKMSKAHKGRKITWIGKIAQINRKITHNDALIIQERLKNGELGRDLYKEYGVHRTTLSKIKMGTYFKNR